METVLALLLIQALAIALLLLRNRRHARASVILSRHYSLEKVISDFSANLTASTLNNLNVTIETGMAQILRTMEAGRVCWYVINEGSHMLERRYCVAKPGCGSSPLRVSADDIPYTFDQLTQGGTVVLHGPADLPEDAQLDRRFLEGAALDGLMLIASTCNANRRGVLGIASISDDIRAADELINQLVMLNNLIVSTIERNVVHEMLQKSEQRFRYLFQEAPIGIALEDPNGELLFVNPAICTMFGYDESEMRGRRCADFADPDFHNCEGRESFEALLSGAIEHYSVEKRFIRKDGRLIWGRIFVSLLKDQEHGATLVIRMMEDITARKSGEQELERARTELQQLAGHLIQVQEEERHRIGRELHDDIGQRLALVAMELDLLASSLEGEGREREIERMYELKFEADSLTSDIHQLSHQLHSAKLQSLGLPMALDELCKQFSRQYQISVDFCSSVRDCRISSDVALCFFRVAQEALSNAVRHSKADHISIALASVNSLHRLSICDRGVGFDPGPGCQGIGLISMRERLRLVGGQLIVRSTIGEGTEVVAEVEMLESKDAAA